MQGSIPSIYATGIFVILVGIFGTFLKTSHDDGALAITGSVLVGAAMIFNAIAGHEKNEHGQ